MYLSSRDINCSTFGCMWFVFNDYNIQTGRPASTKSQGKCMFIYFLLDKISREILTVNFTFQLKINFIPSIDYIHLYLLIKHNKIKIYYFSM
jgi:hypothetical protein